MTDDFLWVEKWRPPTISQCVLPERLKIQFQAFVDKCKDNWDNSDFSNI